MSVSNSSNPKKRPLLYSDDDHDHDHDHQRQKHHRRHDASEIQAQDQIFISSQIQDRNSTFQAHFHPGSSVFPQPGNTSTGGGTRNSTSTTTTTIVKRLQSHPSFATASHRIVAWRRRSTQQTLQLGSTTASNSSSSNSRNLPLAASASALAGGTPNRASSLSLPATTSTFTTGSDDDGEKYAGKRLERVLASMQVEGVIVVARWYGGVMLGPVRFTHMENCATEAVRMWMARVAEVHPGGGGGGGGGHGDRIALTPTPTATATATATAATGPNPAEKQDGDDEAERARLANQLVERDHSIVVLRGLLAEMAQGKASNIITGTESKTGTGTETGDGKPDSSPALPSTAASTDSAVSPTKKLDYSSMSLARLKQLERARDATIAFILRQLDKVEEEQKAREKDMAAASKEDHVDGNG